MRKAKRTISPASGLRPYAAPVARLLFLECSERLLAGSTPYQWSRKMDEPYEDEDWGVPSGSRPYFRSDLEEY